MHKTLLLIAIAAVACVPAHAGLFAWTNLCAQSYPTEDIDNPVLNCSGGTDSGTDSAFSETFLDVSNIDPGDGVYSGYGMASLTQDVWKLAGSVSLENYARKNRVNIPDPFVLQGMVLALGSITDQLTVEGGVGVYNLSYIYSIEGTSAADSYMYAFFCAVLAIPEGVGTVASFCTDPGDTSQLVTLTYSELEFGGPINPVLAINIGAGLDSLLPEQVEAEGDVLVTGTASADFASTIRLQSVLITDKDGNPIPGVTIKSANNWVYPLDPANQGAGVPEPSTFLLGTVGLGALACRRARAFFRES